MLARSGLRVRRTSPGKTAMTALGSRQVGLGGDGGHLRGEVAAGRMAHDREPGPVGPDVRARGRQDVERVADGDQAVGQEVGRGRHPVALIARGDHDPPLADEVLDPGRRRPRVDGEPAVVEDDHGGAESRGSARPARRSSRTGGRRQPRSSADGLVGIVHGRVGGAGPRGPGRPTARVASTTRTDTLRVAARSIRSGRIMASLPRELSGDSRGWLGQFRSDPPGSASDQFLGVVGGRPATDFGRGQRRRRSARGPGRGDRAPALAVAWPAGGTG